MKRAVIYARVSTDGQTIANQLLDLEAVATRMGWTIVAVHADEGISGSKGRDKRPALDALMKSIARREIDVVMAWSVDRLGRSLQHLVSFLAEVQAKHVDLYLHSQGLDTSTPAGRALFGMLGIFAEFERAILVERVKAGLNRARAEGKHCGRPVLDPAKIEAVEKLLAKGIGVNATAREARVGIGTVCRIKQRMAEAA